MAKLKSKKKNVEEVAAKTEEVTTEESTSVTEVETPVEDPSPYMNAHEQEALSTQAEKDAESIQNVSVEKMTTAIQVVQNIFNLSDKNFAVTGFADKGTKVSLSMSNDDFDLVVVVKDSEKHGIL